ncbi:hypothetical protein EMCRGX_G013537 [Ephydatia muelleri]
MERLPQELCVTEDTLVLRDRASTKRERLFSRLKQLRQPPQVLNHYDAIMWDQIKGSIVEVCCKLDDKLDAPEYVKVLGVKWRPADDWDESLLLNIHEKATWWSELFQRMIQSVTLTYDELATVLTEVKAIRNSRPISYLSSEDIEEPLPPSHLLTGHCLLTLPDLTNHERDPTFGDRDPNIDLTRRMQLLAQTLEHFLSRWKTDYLMELRWPDGYEVEEDCICGTEEDWTSGTEEDWARGTEEDWTRGTEEDWTRGTDIDWTPGTDKEDRTRGTEEDWTGETEQDWTRGTAKEDWTRGTEEDWICQTDKEDLTHGTDKDWTLELIKRTGHVELKRTGQVKLKRTGHVELLKRTGHVELKRTGQVKLKRTGHVELLKRTGHEELKRTGQVKLKRTGHVELLKRTGHVELKRYGHWTRGTAKEDWTRGTEEDWTGETEEDWTRGTAKEDWTRGTEAVWTLDTWNC